MDKKRVTIKIKLWRSWPRSWRGPSCAPPVFTPQLPGGRAPPSHPSFFETFQPLLHLRSKNREGKSQDHDCQPSPPHFPDKEPEAGKVLSLPIGRAAS